MARGWESKSVEAQQADRETASGPLAPVSSDEARRRARVAALELARRRAVADRAVATHPAHIAMLEAAMAALDAQLRTVRG